MPNNIVEPTSYLWRQRFRDNHLPKNGTIVEVAPGYEPKIGNALALYGFTGTIFLIEPDWKAAEHIQNIYQAILPQAIVRGVLKPLENIQVGVDIHCGVDALVASHPFDDMVMAHIIGQTTFFSEEKNDGVNVSTSKENLYAAIEDKDYARGIRNTFAVWQDAIQKLKPACFIASQYPSHTLTLKGLLKRGESGFIVLRKLKNFYKSSLPKQRHDPSFGYKGNPKWWIVARKPYQDIIRDLNCEPAAIRRLDESIFVPQRARQLRPDEYDICFVDKKYFKNQGDGNILKHIQKFAIVLDHESPSSLNPIITYADQQKDKTDISLSGNHGSGRAIYYGARFNILGVGKTTLCKSIVPSHSTGKIELIGAMRRVVLSKWINYFTPKTGAHPLLLALKETARFKWNPNPIPLGLLVRIDDGSLDRPSHIEYAPRIPIDLEKTLGEYAKLDAEYFAYRIMLGAWSLGNYSLDGKMIDLETASFVKYRGPYYTACSKYPENRFGYEGIGFLKILKQLADIKKISCGNMEKRFYKKRSRRLGHCFLSLLGIRDAEAASFFSKHQNRVIMISCQFEKLAKKISPQKTNLNLYFNVSDNEDPSLLDMSNLFRHLAGLYGRCGVKDRAFNCLVRKSALTQVKTAVTNDLSATEDQTKASAFMRKYAVVTSVELKNFLRETKSFIHALFNLLSILDSEKCLDKKSTWGDRLQKVNQDLPPMFELNNGLRGWTEEYRLVKISAKNLGKKIEKLSKLPYFIKNHHKK